MKRKMTVTYDGFTATFESDEQIDLVSHLLTDNDGLRAIVTAYTRLANSFCLPIHRVAKVKEE